jgi:hypothetical protein
LGQNVSTAKVPMLRLASPTMGGDSGGGVFHEGRLVALTAAQPGRTIYGPILEVVSDPGRDRRLRDPDPGRIHPGGPEMSERVEFRFDADTGDMAVWLDDERVFQSRDWNAAKAFGDALKAGIASPPHPSAGGFLKGRMPDPPRRTIRMPAIGQRVVAKNQDLDRWPNGRPGVVRGMDVAYCYPAVTVQFDDNSTGPNRLGVGVGDKDYIEPVGDDPRWVEVELPAE